LGIIPQIFILYKQLMVDASGLWFMFMMFNVNNISAISWTSDLLVGEIGVPGENHQSVVSY
jgi:hypothetical protein